ncbi:MAG: Fic family protein [candidate division Zixibacteria bacterium]|nr:Fic family protein [candidate division Zixibacteria bacterium]
MSKTPFIPTKLPPRIDYTSLIKEIGEANNALGQLQGSLINLSNPDLLITPLLTKEAVLSSRIEGTQATLEDVFKYEAEEKTYEESEKEKDVKEIINYRRAMHTAMQELRNRPIGENLIKNIHYILLNSVRGTNKDRGNLRRSQIYIGLPNTPIEEAIYIPPPYTELPSFLSNWEEYVNSKQEKDPLIQIGVAHYQFEAIHPFMDGNGRIGRLLIPLFLYQRELLSYPLLYISEYFEERRKDYYDFLKNVTEKGDWESWLKFFLMALAIQSLKTQTTVMKILILYKKLKDEIGAINAVYAIHLLDIIFASPIVSFVNIKKRIKAKSYQTIYNLLTKFVKIGILEEIPGRKRNRIFVFKQLLEILR